MKQLLTAYGVGLVVLGALDALWLGVIAADFYQARIGHLMAASPRLGAALAFYLLYPLGVLLFAVRPGLAAADAGLAARLGAAFGFFAYATYDLTNLATLRDWPLSVSVVDVGWGTVISAVAAWAGCSVAARGGRTPR